jgi:glycosyltransferase involved in cell wall biosynthesis
VPDQATGEAVPGAPRTSRRIALALESSGPGGAEQVLLHLASGLRERGFDPVIVTPQPGWMTERAERAGLPVWIVPQRHGLAPDWVPRFAWRLRRAGVGLVHAHEFTMNVYAGLAARLAGVPAVATLHGRHWGVEKPRRILAYRGLRTAGMRLVAVSEDLARFLAGRMGLAPDALSVVHNGVPVPPLPSGPERVKRRAEARAALGIAADGNPLLVAVGNLYPVKDHATLLRAAALLPDVRVAIAGRGQEESRLRDLAGELGLGDRLHLLGLRDDVERVLAAADVLVQPSHSEGLPLAVLEAMGAGLPVVATRVGGVPEAVLDSETGRLVAPGDPEALAAALRGILADRERAAALGAAGHGRARAEFSVEAMLQRYVAIYGEVARWPDVTSAS